MHVVVVTYQGAPWIRRCLQSLVQSLPRPAVVVVDNCSTDGTCDLVKNEFPTIQLVRAPRNLGFGIANNLGIKHALVAGATQVLLLNQDAYVLPDALGKMQDYLLRHPHVGVVSPLHCSPDPHSLDEKTLQGYLSKHFVGFLSDAVLGQTKGSYAGLGLNAAAWCVRADVFRRFGGFDPLFFMYGEDDDLLFRWRHHQVVFHLLPGVRVVHLRESVKPPDAGLFEDILRRARRRRSSLLCGIKRPNFGLLHMISVWVSEGLLKPLYQVPMHRNVRELVAAELAAAMLLFELPKVRRSQRLTRAVGAHFLGLPVHSDPESSGSQQIEAGLR